MLADRPLLKSIQLTLAGALRQLGANWPRRPARSAPFLAAAAAANLHGQTRAAGHVINRRR